MQSKLLLFLTAGMLALAAMPLGHGQTVVDPYSDCSGNGGDPDTVVGDLDGPGGAPPATGGPRGRRHGGCGCSAAG